MKAPQAGRQVYGIAAGQVYGIARQAGLRHFQPGRSTAFPARQVCGIAAGLTFEI